MENILIYGGSGIISSEVVNLCIQKGFEVTMINRGKRERNLKAKTIIADLKRESKETLHNKITDMYDVVIDFLSYDLNDLKKNMELVKGKCRQYIFISSATVYKTKKGRYKETDDIGESKWNYANNKVLCEEYVRNYANDYGFLFTIVRPYITYGKTRIPFQFSPLEYYTVIERMKRGKPIVVHGIENHCTLTSSRDFAVALTGLINNRMSINEVFHITGQYETTWISSLHEIAKAFDVSCSIIKLYDDDFYDEYLMRGLNNIEVISDKSRDMLFDNSKIKNAVPEFNGDISLSRELIEITKWYKDKRNQQINYSWDGRLDRLLSNTKYLKKVDRKKLKFMKTESSSLRDRIVYTINRYDLLYNLSKYLGIIK